MQYHDYYATLGVPRDASAADIKKAFRKLARKYHPDVSKEQDAERRMQELNEAYAVLADTQKRAAYDQLGSGYQSGQDFQPPPEWDSGAAFTQRTIDPREAAEFSEFFSQLFGGLGATAFRGQRGNAGASFGRAAHQPFAMRGQDHHASITLSIEDSLHGATRQLSLRIPTVDRGQVVHQQRTLNVKIPTGITAGQTIRLAGQGEPGVGGAPAGDLLLETQFAPHAVFSVVGRDLHRALRITPWEAALGAVLTVALPDGEVKVRIPAGAQSGQTVRVRGKGLPSKPAGDLLLELQVVLPPADTPQAKALYETMARELHFNPRSGDG